MGTKEFPFGPKQEELDKVVDSLKKNWSNIRSSRGKYEGRYYGTMFHDDGENLVIRYCLKEKVPTLDLIVILLRRLKFW